MRSEVWRAEDDADEEVMAAQDDDLIVLNRAADSQPKREHAKDDGAANQATRAAAIGEGKAAKHHGAADAHGHGIPQHESHPKPAQASSDHGTKPRGIDLEDEADVAAAPPSSSPSLPAIVRDASTAQEAQQEPRAANAEVTPIASPTEGVGGYDLVDLVLAIAGTGVLIAAACLLRSVQHKMRVLFMGKSRVN